MRKDKVFYALFTVAFCLSLLFQLTLVAGCASAPPDRVALRSLQVTAKSVDTAMQVAGDLHSNGFIDDKQKEDVLKAYATYQSSMTLAVLTLDAVRSRNDIPAFTEAVNKAAKALIDLINSFNKPTKPTLFYFYPLIPEPLLV
jgi:hypothetical protein